MVIRNDRPTTPKPTSTPTPTTGPADAAGSTGVDDDLDAAGVTDIEKLAGQSLADGMSVGTPSSASSTSSKRPLPTRNPEATANARDPSSIAKLINAAAEGLSPGESVVLGGKLSAGEGLVVEAGVSVSVTKRPDGRLDVKVAEAAAAGLGAIAQAGVGDAKAGGEAKGLFGLTHEATWVVATGEEAAVLAAKFAARVATSATPLGPAARVAFDATTGTPNERKFALTTEVEVEGSLLAGFTLKGGGASGLVESPPGSWFVELELEEGGKASLGLEQGLKAKGSVKATVRVPVTPPTADDLMNPSAFAQRALRRATDATVELEVKSSVGRPGAAGEVKAKKEVPLAQIDDAFSTDGWKVTGDVLIGPREESATIAVGELEVTATRSFHVLTKETGSLKDLEKAKQAVDDANLARSGALRSGGR